MKMIFIIAFKNISFYFSLNCFILKNITYGNSKPYQALYTSTNS